MNKKIIYCIQFKITNSWYSLYRRDESERFECGSLKEARKAVEWEKTEDKADKMKRSYRIIEIIQYSKVVK